MSSEIVDWDPLYVVGKGGSSTVYKAFWKKTNSHIAVKQIETDGLNKDQFKGIKAEIETMKELSHPNIVCYFDTQYTANKIFILLEYADKGSLRQLYQRNGPMNDTFIAYYLKQILQGLSYLHSKGIAHRDIKCANCLLSSTGVVKLADFGASKRFESDSIVSGLKGTPHWMAPEVIKGTQMTTGWILADVWSLGCTVVEMLTGKVPYAEYENPMTAMYKIASGEIPPVHIDIANDMKDFISCCCSVTPEKRPLVDSLLKFEFLSKERTTPNFNDLISGEEILIENNPMGLNRDSPVRLSNSNIQNHDTHNNMVSKNKTVKGPIANLNKINNVDSDDVHDHLLFIGDDDDYDMLNNSNNSNDYGYGPINNNDNSCRTDRGSSVGLSEAATPSILIKNHNYNRSFSMGPNTAPRKHSSNTFDFIDEAEITATISIDINDSLIQDDKDRLAGSNSNELTNLEYAEFDLVQPHQFKYINPNDTFSPGKIEMIDNEKRSKDPDDKGSFNLNIKNEKIDELSVHVNGIMNNDHSGLRSISYDESITTNNDDLDSNYMIHSSSAGPNLMLSPSTSDKYRPFAPLSGEKLRLHSITENQTLSSTAMQTAMQSPLIATNNVKTEYNHNNNTHFNHKNDNVESIVNHNNLANNRHKENSQSKQNLLSLSSNNSIPKMGTVASVRKSAILEYQQNSNNNSNSNLKNNNSNNSQLNKIGNINNSKHNGNGNGHNSNRNNRGKQRENANNISSTRPVSLNLSSSFANPLAQQAIHLNPTNRYKSTQQPQHLLKHNNNPNNHLLSTIRSHSAGVAVSFDNGGSLSHLNNRLPPLNSSIIKSDNTNSLLPDMNNNIDSESESNNDQQLDRMKMIDATQHWRYIQSAPAVTRPPNNPLPPLASNLSNKSLTQLDSSDSNEIIRNNSNVTNQPTLDIVLSSPPEMTKNYTKVSPRKLHLRTNVDPN
eukprot:gene4235-6012_t